MTSNVIAVYPGTFDPMTLGHEDVVRKVAGDLGDKADPDTIREKMAALMIEAKAQLMKETN